MPDYSKGGKKRRGATQSVSSGEVDASGNTLVAASLRYVRAITPGASDLTDGPCDALLLSVDAAVTVQADEDTAALALPLKAGVWHPLAARKVTAVTNNATVYGGWLRRPL